MKPILEAQGIEFPDVPGVMSKEERRSSLASTAATRGGRPYGELQVPTSELIEGHKQPLPLLEPDTIDNLAHPTACNLAVMIGGSFRMEVRKMASVTTSDPA
jgi:hypothetical protein